MSPALRCEASLEVKNKYGLHARAARLVVLLLEQFTAEVTITRDDQTVNGRSILGLMMLAAAPGTQLQVVAEGPDADAALAALTAMFAARFNEDA